jgi:hypothetical protein
MPLRFKALKIKWHPEDENEQQKLALRNRK